MIDFLQATSTPLLVVMASMIAVAIGDRVATRRGVDAGWKLWAIVVASVFAARMGHVWQFCRAYLEAPASILDLSDGGWSPEAGFIALWLSTLWIARRHAAMKLPVRVAALSGTLLWGFGAVAMATRTAEPSNMTLPALTLSTQGGAPVELGALLNGKPIVVNLWATWCPPCNREMPLLAQAQADHPEVEFVFIDQGESAMHVNGWISQHHLALRNVMVDTRMQAGAALGQRAYPTSYFFDAGGRLVDMRIGELSPSVLADKLGRLNAPSR